MLTAKNKNNTETKKKKQKEPCVDFVCSFRSGICKNHSTQLPVSDCLLIALLRLIGWCSDCLRRGVRAVI